MEPSPPAPNDTLSRRPLAGRLVIVTALLLLAFKLVHMALAAPFMDETYYWLWGQHPALSYYDHPPLNAWLLGLSSQIFGWTQAGLRAPVYLTLLADIGALALIARQLAGADWRPYFWLTLLLFLTTPIFWMTSNLALPDHVLLCMSLYALVFFLRFFAAREAGGRGETRDLFAGALFLGLAALAKYNAAFMALAIPLYLLLRDRSLFRDPRLYLAGAISLVLQAPVIVWNLTENFASFQFILRGRHAGLGGGGSGVPLFVILLVVFLSPFLLWPILKIVAARRPAPGQNFARVLFVLSTLAILGVSSVTTVLFHWNLMAYVAVLPFLALALRARWLLVAQTLYGIVFAGLAFANYAVTPLLDVHRFGDQASAWSFSFDRVAAAISRARTETGAQFVATGDYTTASLLAFSLGNRDVTSLSASRDAFDDWFDPAAHAGQNAILMGDDFQPLGDAVLQRFASVTPLETVTVDRGGQRLDSYVIYLGTGFTGP